MANLSVKTTFNTILKMNSDTIGRRVGAYFIDVLVMILYLYLLNLILSFFRIDYIESFGDDASSVRWGWQSLTMLPLMFYTLIWEVSTGGYTPGKYAVKIKVVHVNGFQPSFIDFFTRWIFRTVDIYFIIILSVGLSSEIAAFFSIYSVGIIGLIAMARSPRGQRIGDSVAGTAVIKVNEKHSMNITILKELKENYKPRYPQAIKLSDNDARIIKETYENARKRKDKVLALRLVKKIESVMNIEADLPNSEFIETVLKDFNYYTKDL